MTAAPTHAPSGSARTDGRDGFIIVAVLWILIALATLVSVYSIYVGNSAQALAAMDVGVEVEPLVSTALELTAYRVALPTTGGQSGGAQAGAGQSAGAPAGAGQNGASPAGSGNAADLIPTRGQFRFRLGKANVAVSYVTENARIDLNTAPKEMLAGFFATLGANNDQADYYADRVVGWRTASKQRGQANQTDQANQGSQPNQGGPANQDDPAGQGGQANQGGQTSQPQVSEDSVYRSAGVTYGPRGAPFVHLSELWLVYGLPATLVARAMPFVTIYAGRPDINVFDAPAEVIAALPGMTPARLNSFLDRRDAMPPSADALPLLLGPDQKGATADGSDCFRVDVRIAFDNGRRTTSEVVIMRNADSAPYRVLSWRDDVDLDGDQRQTATRRR